MYPQVYKYFVITKKLTIPGIGYFNIKALPAKLDFVERVLHAPTFTVEFVPQNVAADKKLYQYLSKELAIDEWQAVNQFQEFTENLIESVEKNGNIKLSGIGTLRKNINNTLYLEPELATKPLHDDIHLASESNTNSTANLVQLYTTGNSLIYTEELESDQLEKIVKSEAQDYWWVWALVAALMGVGALLYYYI
jgi:hypothetical protein